MICWKPEWCECPDCGPLVAKPKRPEDVDWPEGTYGAWLNKTYGKNWPKDI